MGGTNEPIRVPPAVDAKLRRVRRRGRTMGAVRGLAMTAVVLLAAMMLAMLVDWAVVLFSPSWRRLLTLTALGAAAAAALLGLAPALFRRRPLEAVALDVDRAVPQLEERWATVAEVAKDKGPASMRGAPELIRKVADEAEGMSDMVRARQVVPARRLRPWLIGVGAVGAVLAVILLAAPGQTAVLLGRFWTMDCDLTLTQVRSLTGDRVVARHTTVPLGAAVTGRVRDTAELFIRAADGAEQRIELAPGQGEASTFSHIIDSAEESFAYRFRCGDGQSQWRKVTVVDRPDIAEIRFAITPPTYTRKKPDRRSMLPRRARAIEGSRLEVAFLATKSPTSVRLQLEDETVKDVPAGADGWFRFEADLDETIGFSAVVTDEHGLTNPRPPKCKIIVHKDRRPTVQITKPADEIVAPPEDIIEIAFRARDDLGIADAKMIVRTTRKDGRKDEWTIAIPLGKQKNARDVRGKADLDLGQFKLKTGDEVAYSVQVTDTRDNRSAARAGKVTAGQQARKGRAGARAKSPEAADARTGRDGAPKSPPPSDQQAATPPSSQSPEMAAAQSQQDQSSPGNRPPDGMSRRMLDVPGTCRSGQRRIKIDEWAGSYEGRARKKLQLSISKYLKELDAHLAKAQSAAGSVLPPLQAKKTWNEQLGKTLMGARDHLTGARKTVATLQAKSKGTPYAFIGLQLVDIELANIVPADAEFAGAGKSGISFERRLEHIGVGIFHIDQARQKLAALTRQFQQVARNENVARAFKRLKKMHQLFLEDMHAFLAASKPPLNPRTGEMVEKDDEYIRKLKELLEEKFAKMKKMMEELAEVLAEDPELLRRYMAFLNLHKDTIRDQYTLLANRQKVVAAEVTSWADASPTKRGELLKAWTERHWAGRAAIARDTAKLHENMVTWLPRDLDKTSRQVLVTRRLALELARDAAKWAASAEPEKTISSAERLTSRLKAFGHDVGSLHEIAPANEKLSRFIYKRAAEAGKLQAAMDAWAEKAKNLRSRRVAQAATADQQAVLAETMTLGRKLENVASSLSMMPEKITGKAEELARKVNDGVVTHQTYAAGLLAIEKMLMAKAPEAKAVQAFDEGGKTFDELLTLLEAHAAEMLKNSQTPSVLPPKTLEEVLAMLENEMEACEKLGAACAALNLAIISDWAVPGSGSAPGAGAMGLARGAAGDLGKAQQSMDRLQRMFERMVREEIGQYKPLYKGRRAKGADRRWATLVAKLREAMDQAGGTVPPEQYRLAIEEYYRLVAESVAESERNR